MINFHKRYYCDKPFHSTVIAIIILLLLIISKFEIILWLVVASGHDAQCTPIASYTLNDQNLVDFQKLWSLGSDGTWSQRRLVRGVGFPSIFIWQLVAVDSGQTTWPTKSSSGNWWPRVLARGHWTHKPRGQKISSDSWWSIKNINNKSGNWWSIKK